LGASPKWGVFNSAARGYIHRSGAAPLPIANEPHLDSSSGARRPRGSAAGMRIAFGILGRSPSKRASPQRLLPAFAGCSRRRLSVLGGGKWTWRRHRLGDARRMQLGSCAKTSYRRGYDLSRTTQRVAREGARDTCHSTRGSNTTSISVFTSARARYVDGECARSGWLSRGRLDSSCSEATDTTRTARIRVRPRPLNERVCPDRSESRACSPQCFR